jgi:site-specific recombinase XerD
MALGAGETTLMRMVNAYGIIANGGKEVKATLIDYVEDRYGRPIWRHDPRSLLKALRALFTWAVDAEHVETNPAKLVPKLHKPSEGFHTWTVNEVRQFEAFHKPGSKPRLALWLLLYAVGPRRSDVVRSGRQMIRDCWLTYTPVKTKRPYRSFRCRCCPNSRARSIGTPRRT